MTKAQPMFPSWPGSLDHIQVFRTHNKGKRRTPRMELQYVLQKSNTVVNTNIRG